MAAKKTKGRPGVPGRKHMSNFNDLYDHVAADRSRAMQLLGIQDIRCVKIGCLIGTTRSRTTSTT